MPQIQKQSRRNAVAIGRPARRDKPIEVAKQEHGGAPNRRQGSKQAKLIALMLRPEGATIVQMVKTTGWQPHSVRGAMSGALKKRLGLAVTSEKSKDGQRVYRIAGQRRR